LSSGRLGIGYRIVVAFSCEDVFLQ
jgi:hypothetical protein